jgi:prephenate dehydrogenase
MAKDLLGLIGVGAFGAFAVPHLASHFDLVLHDPHQDLTSLAQNNKASIGDLSAAASCDVVVIAVPVQQMERIIQAIAPHLKPGCLVIEVASVKIKPTGWMKQHLPSHTDAVGLHPLFGPQSGKNGIEGLNVVVCNVRGERSKAVALFLKEKLQLSVFETTPEDHDRQLAYVQGLTHLIAKVVVAMGLPGFQLTTKTFDYMQKMVEMVRYDSDDLFKAIERENPFTAEAKESFFAAARNLEEKLSKDS